MQLRSIRSRCSLALVSLVAALALPSCGEGESEGGGNASGAPPSQTRTEPTAGEAAASVKVEAPAAEGAEAGAPASVHGVVRFEGTPPERKPLTITASLSGDKLAIGRAHV